jgi:hypothetical protein
VCIFFLEKLETREKNFVRIKKKKNMKASNANTSSLLLAEEEEEEENDDNNNNNDNNGTSSSSKMKKFSLEDPEIEKDFFSAVRKYGVGKWKRMCNDSRYAWHRLNAHSINNGTTSANIAKAIRAKLKSHWLKLSKESKNNAEGLKKIKTEITKKNEPFRAPRFRHSYESNKRENELREKEYQLKPFTNALLNSLDRFILECLNIEYDRHEDGLEERDGKTIDQVANYCIEKFREEDEDGLLGKYRFGSLFEVCKGAREQRVPQRLTELGKEGKVRRDRVTVPGDKSGRLHMKYVALVDVNGKPIKNRNKQGSREDTEEEEEEDESESEEESSDDDEDDDEEEEEEEGRDEDADSREDDELKQRGGGGGGGGGTNSNENGSTKKRPRRPRAKNGQTKKLSKAMQRRKIEEELEKLPPVFYYDGRYLTAEQAAKEAREAFEYAELAANEAELAEREAADAEAEARQAVALVESLCAEAERLKNAKDDDTNNDVFLNPVANDTDSERLVQA